MIPPIANRFVAGENVDEALDYARSQIKRDIGVIVNLLGEHNSDPEKTEAISQEYLNILDELTHDDSQICISIKPTQLGLAIDEGLFRENLSNILEAAADANVFVWLDMENHTTTDATLNAYEDFSKEYNGEVGVCVQTNLKRTQEDLVRLASTEGKVRLVKGAYNESKDIAFKKKSRVNRAYRENLRYMFREFNCGIAVASHDQEMIDLALNLHDEHGTDFEFQMLMGVREDVQEDLAEEYEMWQYIPYGDEWLSYFYRRIMERKENALFAARALLGA